MNRILFALALLLGFASNSTAGEYIGEVKNNNHTVVRLLILKHSYESLAEDEQRDIIRAADLAASKGLDISDIGSFHVNKDGHAPRIVWGDKVSLENLKQFVSKQMRVDAKPGDTLVIYTTGHGGGSGGMHNLGLRKNIMRIFAEAAEENDQETVWWQSSCYAAAGLPSIYTLNKTQQELLSMIASSSSSRPSYWGDQTAPMRKVFVALAEQDRALDADENGEITSRELTTFLNTKHKSGAGDLVFAKDSKEPIFGLFGPWSIPIVDRNGSQSKYPRDYIPVPTSR